MSEQRVYNKIRVHYDNDGDWNPAEPGSGRDTHNFQLPAGKNFTRYSVEKLSGSSVLSSCKVSSAPRKGSSGKQSIKVSWSHEPFGKIRYRVCAYGSANNQQDLVKVVVGSNNWENRLKSAVRQNRRISLEVRGNLAEEIRKALSNPFQPPSIALPSPFTFPNNRDISVGHSREPISTSVVITLAICGTIMVIAPLVAAVLAYAINQGYTLNGKFQYDKFVFEGFGNPGTKEVVIPETTDGYSNQDFEALEARVATLEDQLNPKLDMGEDVEDPGVQTYDQDLAILEGRVAALEGYMQEHMVEV